MGLCAVRVGYTCTNSLASGTVCVKVLGAGSLGGATTRQHQAAQDVEGASLSPFLPWGLFLAVHIIQQSGCAYLLQVATCRSYFVFPQKKEISLRS